MRKSTFGVFGGLILLLLFKGCIPDDELSTPVNVNLNMVVGPNTPSINYVEFDNVTIAVQQIRFYGVREEGSDIFFNSQPGAPFGIYVMKRNQASPKIDAFDVPQGVYNQMRWEIQTREIDDDFYEEHFDGTLDDYIDVDDFGMVIEGKYIRQNGREMRLFIAIDPSELLSMESHDAGGNNQLSLISGKTYDVVLEINPYVAIENIERDLLEMAAARNDDDDDDDDEDDDDDDEDDDDDDDDDENGDDDDDKDKDMVDGKDSGKDAGDDKNDDRGYMEISSDEHEELYERILFRLKNTVKAIIEEQ